MNTRLTLLLFCFAVCNLFSNNAHANCNVEVFPFTSGVGAGVEITGLSSDANTKIFTAQYDVVWQCNPWSGTPCTAAETVINNDFFVPNETYYLSVVTNNCNDWIPFTIPANQGCMINGTITNCIENITGVYSYELFVAGPAGGTFLAYLFDIGSGPYTSELAYNQIHNITESGFSGSFKYVEDVNDPTCNMQISYSCSGPSEVTLENCSEDIDTPLSPGQGGKIVVWSAPSCNSTCPGDASICVVNQTAGPASGTFLQLGSYDITYEATDGCGNTASCSFTITVSPQTSIAITCPDDVILNIQSGSNTVTAAWPLPTAQTSCSGGPTIEQIEGPSLGGQLTAGTYTIRYWAINDICGAADFCQFEVTVTDDNTPCTITEQSWYTQFLADPNLCDNYSKISIASSSGDQILVVVNKVTGLGWYSCDGSFFCDESNGNTGCGNVLLSAVLIEDVWTDEDCNQNGCNVNVTTSNGSVTITGLTSAENTKLFDADISSVWQCNPWTGNPCSGTEVISGLASGQYFLSLQSDVCDEWIPITVQGGGGNCSLNATISNCSISLSAPINGVIQVYTYDIFVTGNNTGSKFKIPVYNFPTGISIREFTYGETHTITESGGLSGSSITKSVEDVNDSSCTTTATVSCTPPPSVEYTLTNFPLDRTIQGAQVVSWPEPSCNSTCAGGGQACFLNQISGPSNGDYLELGTYLVTYQAQTVCGSTTYSFTITVLDDLQCNLTGNISNCNITTNSVTTVYTYDIIVNATGTSSDKFRIPVNSFTGVVVQEYTYGEVHTISETGLSLPVTKFITDAADTSCELTLTSPCATQGCNVSATSANGAITITGLTSVENTKLFDTDFNVAFECNPWNGNPCSGTEVVSGLASGQYFLSVQSDACDEWIPITVEGGGNGECEIEATISNVVCGAYSITYDIIVTGTNTSSDVFGMELVQGSFNNLIYAEFELNTTHTISEVSPVNGNPYPTWFIATSIPGTSCSDINYVDCDDGGCNILSVDTDGDGVCDIEDCAPTNPSLPTTPGSPCNDFDAASYNDVIQADGCSCRGTLDSGGCPGGTSNLAIGGSTSQSSTLQHAGITASSDLAIDGNTDGNFNNGSVAATQQEYQAWWEIDLGQVYNINLIEIYNKTNGSDKLQDYYVLVSDTPFDQNGSASNNIAIADYSKGDFGPPSNYSSTEIDSGIFGRYVRIQLDGTGYCTIAEVLVQGCVATQPIPSDNNLFNIEANSKSNNTFNIQKVFPNPADQEAFVTIDSNIEGDVEMEIYNLVGVLQHQSTVSMEEGINSFELNVRDLKAGIYHLFVRNKTGQTKSVRFVKINK